MLSNLTTALLIHQPSRSAYHDLVHAPTRPLMSYMPWSPRVSFDTSSVLKTPTGWPFFFLAAPLTYLQPDSTSAHPGYSQAPNSENSSHNFFGQLKTVCHNCNDHPNWPTFWTSSIVLRSIARCRACRPRLLPWSNWEGADAYREDDIWKF